MKASELSDAELFAIAGIQPNQKKIEDHSDEELMKIAGLQKPSDRGADFQRPEEEAGKLYSGEGFLNTAKDIVTQGIPQIAKNIGSDVLENVKGIAGAISSPIETIKGVGGFIKGAGENLISDKPVSERSPEAQMAMQAGESLAKSIVDPSKDLTFQNVKETLSNTAYEKPFSTLTALTQGGKLAKLNPALKSAELAGKAAIETGKMAATASKGLKKAGDWLAKFGTSQATGISPKSISRILEKPEDFSPEIMQKFTKEAVGSDVFNTLNGKLDELSETGKAYKPVRASGKKITLGENSIENVFEKHGIKIDEKGKLIFDRESIPTSSADESALQKWYDTYGKDKEHTSNSFLNARKSLDNIAQWDASKTDAANVLAKDLRKTINESAHNQIPELKNLDDKFSSQISELKGIKRDYFNADGTLKDNALSKLSNLSNEGRETVLSRLENIIPGVSEKLKTLKAVQDIESASGQKVGAYLRASVGGAALAFANPTLIIGSILSSPKIATQILRGYGKLLKVKDSTINSIVNQFKSSHVKPSKTMAELYYGKNAEKNAGTGRFDGTDINFTMREPGQNAPAVVKNRDLTSYNAQEAGQRLNRGTTQGKPYTKDQVIDAQWEEVPQKSLPKRPALALEAPKKVMPGFTQAQMKETTAFRKSAWKLTPEEFEKSYTMADFVKDMGLKSKQNISSMKDPIGFKESFLKKQHKMSVEEALKDGKPVPQKVVNQYPDLKSKYMRKTIDTPPVYFKKSAAFSVKKGTRTIKALPSKSSVIEGDKFLKRKQLEILKKMKSKN